MKNVIIIIALFFSLSAFAQAPKNATGILLTDSVSTDQMISTLMSNGYIVSDVNDYVIKTEVKSVKAGMTLVRVDIICTKVKQGYMLSSYITMGGLTIDGTGFGASRSASANKGMNNSPNRVAFAEIQAIADQMGNYEYKF